MKSKDLNKIGIPAGAPAKLAIAAASKLFAQGLGKHEALKNLETVAAAPRDYAEHELYGKLAKALVDYESQVTPILPREIPISYAQYGTNLEEASIKQMENACRLPVAVAGALMPDAHLGYGLPIGGVLATDNVVIPFAVGVDIACRMKITVLDVPVTALSGEKDRLIRVLERETSFGVGAHFKQKRDHAVIDEDWSFSVVTKRLKDKAWKQLGTSGSGNHFVEFGTLTVLDGVVGLAPGVYLSVLSHSGSRGSGQEVAKHAQDCQGSYRT
jgi:tRNA-splicing ligase RtcB